jgi:helix-turn-helix protein
LELTPRRQLARKSPSQPVLSPPIARKPGEPFNPYGLFTGIYVPEAICRYRGLSLGAKMVYGRFCRYSGRDGLIYPSISTLASELGIGKTQARGYVQELERKQFLAVDRENRHFGLNGAGGSNRYLFLWHIAFDGAEGELRKTPPVRKTGPLPLRKTGGEESHHQESQFKESPSKNNLAAAPAKFASGEAQSPNQPDSFSVDGDEKLHRVPQYGSP